MKKNTGGRPGLPETPPSKDAPGFVHYFFELRGFADRRCRIDAREAVAFRVGPKDVQLHPELREGAVVFLVEGSSELEWELIPPEEARPKHALG